MGILDFIHIKVTKINLFDIIWHVIKLGCYVNSYLHERN